MSCRDVTDPVMVECRDEWAVAERRHLPETLDSPSPPARQVQAASLG
jgi:hypothetical protein